jgi:hypothetical protein
MPRPEEGKPSGDSGPDFTVEGPEGSGPGHPQLHLPLALIFPEPVAPATARDSPGVQVRGILANPGLRKAQRRVTFAPAENLEKVFEDLPKDEGMVADLQAYRKSDVDSRRADHDRMERLVGPVLLKDHRLKIWASLQAAFAPAGEDPSVVDGRLSVCPGGRRPQLR